VKQLLFAVSLIASCSWPLAQAQDQPGRDVESLLVLARERNPDLSGMRLDAEAAAERIQQSQALPDPRLRLELMDTNRYTLTQELPWFGTRDLKRDIAAHSADSASAQASALWADLAARVKTGYAQLYFLKHTEQLSREILGLMARLEQIAQARYANGLAAQQDAIRAQVEQTAMQNDLLALDSERRQAQSRMNALLSRPAQAPLAEPQNLRALPTEESVDFARLETHLRSNNPLLAASASLVKAADKNMELVRQNRYPTFTVGVAPLQVVDSFRQWGLMFEINIPLQQSTRRSQEREAQLMLEAAQTRLAATANQTLSDLSENLVALDSARRTETLVSARLLPQAELTLQSALAGYENGKVDFSTVLEAQRQIRTAKQSQLKAQWEGQIRLAQIERLLGEDL
jgi:outer membrane protein TolC